MVSTASIQERSRTIQLATIFKLSLYAMVAFSSIMLTISEGLKDGLPPQTLTVAFVIAAFFVVDRWRIWSLPWWAAGGLGLVSLVAAFWGIPQYIQIEDGVPAMPAERRLDLIFAGAHLLVYLTWIVLFLEKSNQQYWWLWALCVLQIAVGASQSTESLFGVLLSGYLFLAVWTLSVFSLLQGQQQFDRAQQIAQSTQRDDGDEQPDNPKAAELADRAYTKQPARSPIPWQAFWRRPSQAIGNVQRDPTASWINLRFIGGVIVTATLAFVLALLFFFLIPRHPSIWRRGQSITENSSRVGFSRNLSLGDIGQILESTKKVMEVRLTDYQTGETLDIEKYAVEMGYDEPLFRGMAAVEYQRGRWQTWEPDDPFNNGKLAGFAAPRGRLVKQSIRLESADPELLFAMPPIRYGEMEDADKAIRVERLNMILKRPILNDSGETTNYAILSPNTASQPGTLAVGPLNRHQLRRWRKRFLQIPSDLPEICAIAREKSGMEESPQPPPSEMARRLEDYLKNSGEFQYTLNADVEDKEIDPLEDFLINRKVGHCEYFASALAIMLRCVEIPSRLVSGFKGGEYNSQTGHFEVEERHAHAWVEAYIDDRWVILDPTPASRAESVASLAAEPGGWKDFRYSLRDFWQRFVVQLSVSEQRRLLAPFKVLLSETFNWLRNGREHFASFVKRLAQQLKSPERWVSWQGGLATFLLLTFLSGVAWSLRAAWRLFLKLRAQYFDPQGVVRTVAFYERFRRDCQRAGLSRTPAQTPQEFALEVRNHFRPVFETPEWGTFPLSLVSAYYDVRYGARQLNEQTLSTLESQLTRFESLLDEDSQNGSLTERPKANGDGFPPDETRT